MEWAQKQLMPFPLILEFVLSEKEKVSFENKVYRIISQSFDRHYGNTYCGVFKQGGTKLERFLPFAQNTGSKNPVRNRLKIQFIEHDFSNLI